MPDSALHGPKAWLLYAFATTILWGFWGAFTDLPPEHGFPETLVYCVWSLTMIVPALYVLARAGWQLDRDLRSIAYGMIIGLLGAGGQMLLFYAVRMGPAYLVFPIISLSPMVTIVLSYLLLGERTNNMRTAGIVLALLALPLFDFSFQGLSPGSGAAWFLLAVIVMASWGVQAFFMKLANKDMSAESIFFYMMVTGLMLTPVAWAMTDFSQPINWGAEGPLLAAGIQLLNAIGALTLVYAFRYGKAIVVSPLTNAGAPLMTAVISLIVIGTLPGRLKLVGLLLACIAAVLLAMAPEDATPASAADLKVLQRFRRTGKGTSNRKAALEP
jgi:uncharacterized membrane protein